MGKFAAVLAKATKVERQEQRAKIGSLKTSIVSTRVQVRYARAFQLFFNSCEEPFSSFSHLDLLLCAYIDGLWQEGEPLSLASHTIAAVQFFLPLSRRKLVGSWKLLSAWNKLELPSRACPLTPLMLWGFAGFCKANDLRLVGHGLIVSFCLFLRTSEIFSLTVGDVSIDSASSEAVIILRESKSISRKKLKEEKLVLRDPFGIACLRSLIIDRLPGDKLIPISQYMFRKLWSKMVYHFGINDLNLMPYSIRRGGATYFFRVSNSMDLTMMMGRWSHMRTARIYIEDGLATMARMALSAEQKRRLAILGQFFRQTEIGKTK